MITVVKFRLRLTKRQFAIKVGSEWISSISKQHFGSFKGQIPCSDMQWRSTIEFTAWAINIYRIDK